MLQTIRRSIAVVLTIGLLLVGGCSLSAQTPDEPNRVAGESQRESLPHLDGMATVVMKVNGSPITIELNGKDAPITAGNFVDLAQRGVYDNVMFHRVIRQPQPFVAQGGDPLSKDPSTPTSQLGTGNFVDPMTGQPRYIPLEIKPEGADKPTYGQTISKAPKLKHERGAVAMARSSLPNSASAQFYFALSDLDFLDGNYAVFGRVVEGMDVVDSIQQGDRIESVEVVKGLDNLEK